jgi:hypothetical protein
MDSSRRAVLRCASALGAFMVIERVERAHQPLRGHELQRQQVGVDRHAATAFGSATSSNTPTWVKVVPISQCRISMRMLKRSGVSLWCHRKVFAGREQAGQRNAPAQHVPEVAVALKVQAAAGFHAEHQLHAQAHAHVLQHLAAFALAHEAGELDRLAAMQAVDALLVDGRVLRLGIDLDLHRKVGVAVGNERALDHRLRQVPQQLAEARAAQFAERTEVMQRLARRRVLVEAPTDVGVQALPLAPQDLLEELAFGGAGLGCDARGM